MIPTRSHWYIGSIARKACWGAAFLLLLFSPVPGVNDAYNHLFSCVLILVLLNPSHSIRMGSPGRWFLVWAVWSAICCMASKDAAMAFQGFYMRVEGLLTLAVLTCLAVRYWQTFQTLAGLRWIAGFALLVVTTVSAIQQLGDANALMYDVAFGSFAAMGTVLLGTWEPAVALLGVVAVALSNMRSAIFAVIVAGGVYVILRFWTVSKIWKKLAVVVGALIVLAFMLPSMRTKLQNFHVSGEGSRSQWIRQTLFLSTQLPLTGYGLDTLSQHLQSASGETQHRNVTVDRTHNVFCDVLLMTGWIGLFMLLTAFGYAARITWQTKSAQNVSCFCMVVAWVAFGCLNPQGIPAHALAIISIFGIRKNI